MANIKIENKVINVTLLTQESVKVPSTEVWKVNIFGLAGTEFKLNGIFFNNRTASGAYLVENLILKAGNTISTVGLSESQLFISGLVIN